MSKKKKLLWTGQFLVFCNEVMKDEGCFNRIEMNLEQFAFSQGLSSLVFSIDQKRFSISGAKRLSR